MTNENSNRDNRFQTTSWTLILQAAQDDLPAAREALEKLCCVYWSPLYAFLRRAGHNEHDARDTLQSFFVTFLERNDFQSADAGKGKFRTYLLGALKNFLANEKKYRGAMKRGGSVITQSIDWQNAEKIYSLEPQDYETPERAFERQWAMATIQLSIEQLQNEMAASGRPVYFSEISHFLSNTSDQRTYREIATRLGLSESAIKNAVHRMRARFRKLLLERIAETIDDANDLEAEINILMNSISRT